MRETQHIEWKETWRDEFLRWICGFANAEGGVLHIGRNDRGVVVGAHASTPFNPAIASVFFRSGEIETWGRGIQRIFTACKAAGTPRPSLTFDGTGLALEFRYASEYRKAMPSSEPPPTPQVTPQVEKLLRAAESPLSREELQQQVGLADRKHFRETLLNPLIGAGWLAMTIPEAPNSRLQKYRLTTKGRAWLEKVS